MWPYLTKREVEKEKDREDLGMYSGKEKNGIKNTKICLAHITFSASIVPNMALHYLSMSNFLVFRTFDM